VGIVEELVEIGPNEVCDIYTTPLQNSWQQFHPPEICNHTCDSRSRHSAQAEAKVVPPLLLSTPFHSEVIPLHSGLLCSILDRAEVKMLRDKEWREVDSLIYKERKVYVPKDDKLRAEIIRLHHDTPVGGHGGQ